MSDGWEQILVVAGPLLGVLLGSVLTRAGSRKALIQAQSMTEVAYRREHFATYQKALWAYAARVKVARDLVSAAKAGTQGSGRSAAPL